MRKTWRIVLTICVILLILGVAVMGVGLFTGGNFSRILYTTDIADMTKFFSREQIESVVSLFFR